MRIFIYKIILFIVIGILSIGIAKTTIAQPEIDCKDLTEIKAYARCEVVQQWNFNEWEAFNTIIEKESNWLHTAQNPNSSAFGYGQAMLSLHDVPNDYKENPQTQIVWAISYISKRYETPTKSLQFHLENGYY